MLFEDKILSLGEKIDILCDKLDLKQKDLKGDFTRTNIYLAKKNGKCTPKIAEAIAEAFNKRIIEGKYDYEKITVEDLLLTEDEQANKKMELYCEKIYENAVSKKPLEDINENIAITDNLINSYNIDSGLICKRLLYISEAYYYAHKYHLCKTYAIKTFAAAINNDNIIYIIDALNQFIKSLYFNCEYEDIEMYAEMAKKLTQAKNITMNEELRKVYYNTALAFSKQNQPEKCLEYLNDIDESKLPKDWYYDILILKSICYRKLNELKKSEQTLINIINEVRDIAALNPLALAYANLAFLEAEKNDLEKCKEHINTATKINSNDTYHTLILCDCFRASLKINNIKYIHDNYLIYINYVIELNQKKLITEAIQEVFYYFLKHNNTKEIESMINEISSIINNEEYTLPCDISIIFIEAVNYFSADLNKYNQYFDLCLKMQRKLCAV
ncbi:hypothetical protein [Rhodopseudomonas parapalustris]